MSYIMSWLVKRASISNSSTNKALVFYLLVTMATMLGGWIIYLLSPNANGIIDAVGINMLIMTVGVIVILRYWERSLSNQLPFLQLVKALRRALGPRYHQKKHLMR